MKKPAETRRRKIRMKTITVKKHFIRKGKIVETIVAVAANIKTNTAAATADTIKIIEISQNLKETATIVEFMGIKRLNAGKRNEITAEIVVITVAEIVAIMAAEIAAIMVAETEEIM